MNDDRCPQCAGFGTVARATDIGAVPGYRPWAGDVGLRSLSASTRRREFVRACPRCDGSGRLKPNAKPERQ